MSDALGKPWIESSVTRVLVEHAHELPSPPKLKGRAQIIRFLTFREDSGDGRQPIDRDTVLWAEITDKQWVIPVRIANGVTNKFEDEHKRALTYYRRGFFTLTAALAYDFVVNQVPTPSGGSRVQQSNRKSLILDVVELNFISGGGSGAPVASNSVVLQICPVLRDWEDALSIGGQTLAKHQQRVKVTLESDRKGKAIVRRTASNSAGRSGNKGSAKTSAQALPHQTPSNDKLGPFHEWQDAYWGRRHKYRDMNFEFTRGEFDISEDQQAILEQIEERIKNATSSQPYNPTNSTNRPTSAPDQQHDLPSFRSSQIYTSTPLDAQRARSSSAASQTPYENDEAGDCRNSEDEDEDDKSEISLGRRVRSTGSGLEDNAVSGAAPEVDEPPDPDAEDVEYDPQLLSQLGSGSDKSLEPDDAVSEKILSSSAHNDTAAETESSIESRAPLHQPIVLVPDSDPQGSSQVQPQPTQVRGSSPLWDIESSGPSRVHSPEVPKTNKGKRRFSPTLSSPLLQPSSGIHNPSQLSGQTTDQSKGTAGSGQSTSQESVAAASLPSPPPEHLPTQSTLTQLGDRFDTLISNEQMTHEEHRRNETPQESFEQVPRVGPDIQPSPNPRKRRRSPSRPRDEGLTLASVGGVAVTARDGDTGATKRRRLGDSDAYLATENTISCEDTPDTRVSQTSNTESAPMGANPSDLNHPNPQDARATPRNPRVASPSDPTVIPHDHDAWSAPSYLATQAKSPKPKTTETGVTSSTRTPSTSLPPVPAPVLPKRQVVKPKPRFAPLPPFGRPIAERAVSPHYPQVTASQVADADEDAEMLPLPAVKVEPPTPARPTKGRASILASVPSRPHASISYSASQSANKLPPPILKKTGRVSITIPAAESSASSGADARESIPNLKAQQEPRSSKARVSGAHDSDKAGKKGKSVDPQNRGRTTQRKLLSGFQPSISPTLEGRYACTWDMWLKYVREAESFWQDEDSDPEL
ncbi:Large tegument protein deneddylase [Ceratobasidium sp. AG-Ba]|nr:Large tegument protein deneddylase [Ceratobasidium sp. AG-Ba]